MTAFSEPQSLRATELQVSGYFIKVLMQEIVIVDCSGTIVVNLKQVKLSGV
jgi:hypothetical protein